MTSKNKLMRRIVFWASAILLVTYLALVLIEFLPGWTRLLLWLATAGLLYLAVSTRDVITVHVHTTADSDDIEKEN